MLPEPPEEGERLKQIEDYVRSEEPIMKKNLGG